MFLTTEWVTALNSAKQKEEEDSGTIQHRLSSCAKFSALFEKLVVTQMVIKFSPSYGTQRFMVMFTSAHHWTPSWAMWIPHTLLFNISLYNILSYMLMSPKWSVPSNFLPKFCMHFSCSMCGTCPAHLILIMFGEKYKLWSSKVSNSFAGTLAWNHHISSPVYY
jgi:hypothetical protein